MPTSRRSAAVSRSDSLNASACTSQVLLWSMVKSSDIPFKLPLASRWESSWARYSVLTRSAATRRRRRCSSSRRRPRAAACRSGACAP
eukprot:87675-Pleurochrysis_carterae.AAC.1